MILGSVQPSYLAWIPLFERMKMSDVFVHLDDVEYSKNSFHNRNRIKTQNGPLTLTVPALYTGHSKENLNQIKIDYSKPWQKKHWKSIEFAYGKAPFFKEVGPPIMDLLLSSWDTLADLNISIIEFFKKYLGIQTPTHRSSQLKVEGIANQKLVSLCKEFKADHFIVKPDTEEYHPKDFFASHGIAFTYFAPPQRAYVQLHGPFIPHLSALDYAMNCGPESF